MEFIVDVQGFKRANNEFVFKELAILPLQPDAQPLVYLFEPPCPWNSLAGRYKSENLWLTHNYHEIHWTAGDVSYDELRPILQDILRSASVIYVKGLEKKNWLEKYLLNVQNLEDFNCPSLKKIKSDLLTTCTHHTFCSENCAVKNVKILRDWFLDPPNQYIRK
ncbi:uncharacterized protein LOC122512394 [Leptopilina heterotoma]|uniref:uncharacterized protein LOC122512394 n=1 Tax=Leptopilina heterotoma TaxID=63436 RepID=UPI001CA9EE52|nr:uncharacterized protein LOC122512394 [Leptopilina heterotoma]